MTSTQEKDDECEIDVEDHGVIKRLYFKCSDWADAQRIKTINGWLTYFWIANLPVVIALYFIFDTDQFQNFCLFYLAIVSIWANIASHFAAWVAGRTDVAVEESDAI